LTLSGLLETRGATNVGFEGKDANTVKLNKLLDSLLKAAIAMTDQTVEQVRRVPDRASSIAKEAKSVVYPEQNHTLRSILSFTAGIGLGVAVGIVLAPASGAETRDSINEKLRDIADNLRQQFSPARVTNAARTEAP
jgi:YtxH-like protein